MKVRLHRGVAVITQKDRITVAYKIKKVSLAPQWIIFVLGGRVKTLIIDESSTDSLSYRAMRREINSFNPDQ